VTEIARHPLCADCLTLLDAMRIASHQSASQCVCGRRRWLGRRANSRRRGGGWRADPHVGSLRPSGLYGARTSSRVAHAPRRRRGATQQHCATTTPPSSNQSTSCISPPRWIRRLLLALSVVSGWWCSRLCAARSGPSTFDSRGGLTKARHSRCPEIASGKSRGRRGRAGALGGRKGADWALPRAWRLLRAPALRLHRGQ